MDKYTIGMCIYCKQIKPLKNGICAKCKNLDNPFKDLFGNDNPFKGFNCRGKDEK